MIEQLYRQWIALKDAERIAAEQRREIEDEIIAKHNVNLTEEGTETIEDGVFTIKLVRRLNRKVDAEMVQQIAREQGLDDQVERLFRWKADINTKNWKATDENLTGPFVAAITTKPARPTVSVSMKEE